MSLPLSALRLHRKFLISSEFFTPIRCRVFLAGQTRKIGTVNVRSAISSIGRQESLRLTFIHLFRTEYYIPSQVKAMNDYLHHLDSTTTASRDRQMRKAAREARDEFIASKKRCVKARIEVSNWSSPRRQARWETDSFASGCPQVGEMDRRLRIRPTKSCRPTMETRASDETRKR